MSDDSQSTEKNQKRQGNYTNAKYTLIELTEEQKNVIDQFWDKENLLALTRRVFNDTKLDGRSTEGRSVKAYISSKGNTVPTTKYVPKGDLELTEEQQNFLLQNHDQSKVTEMARILFPERDSFPPGCPEIRAIYKFLKSVTGWQSDMWEEPVETPEYKPPVNIMATIGRVNEYVSNPQDPTRVAYHSEKLSAFEEKCLRALQGHLKGISFRYQAQQYDKKMDRILFENHFITLVHDKPDLTASDVNLYIAASAAKVKMAQTERRLQKLLREMDEESENTADGGRPRISMNMVELINGTQDKLDKCVKEYQNIIKSLEDTRAARVDLRTRRSESILPLLEAWQQDEEARKNLIKQGLFEKEADEKEIQRLTDFDAVVALVAGITVDEAKS